TPCNIHVAWDTSASRVFTSSRVGMSRTLTAHRFLFPLEGLDPDSRMLFLGFEEQYLQHPASRFTAPPTDLGRHSAFALLESCAGLSRPCPRRPSEQS